jgi:hypothetical protein
MLSLDRERNGNPMRLSILIAAAALATPIGLYPGTASAQYFEDQSILFGRPYGSVYQGRWCANQNAGGRMEEDCHFDSFEQCRLEAIQGNRGFCTQNPHYVPRPAFETRRKKRSRSR